MHPLRSAPVVVFAAILGAPAFAQTEEPAPTSPTEAQDSATETSTVAPTASATLRDVNGNEIGTVTLRQTRAGVLVEANVSGLPAGPHGFHFHETGQCEPPFESAGGHYNPTNASHGFLAEAGPHVGDMPNLIVPESGATTVEILSPFVSLDQASGNTVFDEDGTSLVVHAGPDDHATDPSGNSGDRIACGVIE